MCTGRWYSRRPAWSTWANEISRRWTWPTPCTAGTVRHASGERGAGVEQRWYVIAPLGTGEFLTCVFRTARPRDLEAEGAFLLSATGQQEPVGRVDSSMRLCVSARVSDEDEVRSYRRWR